MFGSFGFLFGIASIFGIVTVAEIIRYFLKHKK